MKRVDTIARVRRSFYAVGFSGPTSLPHLIIARTTKSAPSVNVCGEGQGSTTTCRPLLPSNGADKRCKTALLHRPVAVSHQPQHPGLPGDGGGDRLWIRSIDQRAANTKARRRVSYELNRTGACHFGDDRESRGTTPRDDDEMGHRHSRTEPPASLRPVLTLAIQAARGSRRCRKETRSAESSAASERRVRPERPVDRATCPWRFHSARSFGAVFPSRLRCCGDSSPAGRTSRRKGSRPR